MVEEVVMIKVTDAIGSSFCVSSSDGNILHGMIREHLEAGRRVKLSFDGVDSLTSAFLNAAIGQLYGEYDEDRVRTSVAVDGMDQPDLALLQRVVATAKEYFIDRQRFEEARREILGDDDE